MSLFVETVDYAALPADIIRSIETGDAYRVPCHVSQNLDHYQFVDCQCCGKPIVGHVWFAADRFSNANRVLRCSNGEEQL